MATSTATRTKAHLIDTLAQRGLSRTALTHLSLPALGELIDQTQSPQPRLATLATLAEGAKAAPTTSVSVVHRRRRPVGGTSVDADTFEAVLKLNPRWSRADIAKIVQLAAGHSADGCRPAPDGMHVEVVSGHRVVFRVSRHQIELLNGTCIRLSTARPIRPSV